MKKQTFKKTALSLAIALSVGGIATQAIAQDSAVTKNDFKAESNASKIPFNKENKANGSLIEVGTPQNLMNLKGFAKNLPLIDVLKQITPNDWIVKKSKGRTLDLQKPVSWTGGKNWVETLRQVVENNAIEASVNWNKKEVVLAQIENKENVVSKPRESIGVFELSTDVSTEALAEVITEGHSGQSNDANESINEKNKAIVQTTVKVEKVEKFQMEDTEKTVETKVEQVQAQQVVAAPVEVIKTWSFEGKDNLRDVVESWGEKAGYKVVYNGENYPLDKEDTRVLSGEYDANDGPIRQLAEDYGPDSRVKQPLSFLLYQNKRLVVENLRYQQSGYPQYMQK